MKAKPCEWCNNQFEASVSYQIYCSVDCREQATKEKIADRYMLARRKNRFGKERRCKACGNMLSAYNDDYLCQGCLVSPVDVAKALKEIKGIADGKKSLE